jgi:toxin ParE1/3/4
MAYLVKLMPRAQRDLASLFDYVHAAESATAFRWYEGLRREIFTLEKNPNRCPIAPEGKHSRHLLYGRKPHVYRVIYRVLEQKKRVEVLHIRHGARRRSIIQDES